MKKQFLSLTNLTIFVAAFLVLGPYAYAEDTSQFNHFVQGLQTHRAKVEAQLGIKIKVTHRRPSLYYDGLLGNYEQEIRVIRDIINKDIQFNEQLKALHAHRAQIESQLGIDPKADPYPHATSYYDDLVDHYEQSQIMSDRIDESIR